MTTFCTLLLHHIQQVPFLVFSPLRSEYPESASALWLKKTISVKLQVLSPRSTLNGEEMEPTIRYFLFVSFCEWRIITQLQRADRETLVTLIWSLFVLNEVTHDKVVPLHVF